LSKRAKRVRKPLPPENQTVQVGRPWFVAGVAVFLFFSMILLQRFLMWMMENG
jgi:hypothetical protein